MKKLVSLLLAIMMVFSLAVTAFAVDDPKGSITINGASTGTEYYIYRILDLTTFDKDSGAYTYEPNTKWNAFFEQPEIKQYITITPNATHAGYDVTWVGQQDDATYATFAQEALKYAKENDILPENTTDADVDYGAVQKEGKITYLEGAVKFTDLNLGWYLVDSNAGALCGLTTTDRDASVTAKNEAPTVDKQVQEDLSGFWGDTNTADIGQIVNFMSIIHVRKGYENYALHDKMSEGLTFVHNTEDTRGVTEVKVIYSDSSEFSMVEGTHYVVKTGGESGALCENGDCTFEVKFTPEGMEKMAANARVIAYYNAMLNRHAEVGTTEGNPNETWLEYGEEKYTTHDQTTTYTFSIDIIKTDSSNKLIDGAKFKIYDAATGGSEVPVVILSASCKENAEEKDYLKDSEGKYILFDLNNDGNGDKITDITEYRRARADETGVEILAKDGKVTVVGFDNGDYYLEEVAAPEGYNKLTSRTKFTITDQNLDSIFNGSNYSSGSGVHVVNKTGSMLPETGAMGTTAFIAFGMFVMLGTGILLVTKKRMSMIED